MSDSSRSLASATSTIKNLQSRLEAIEHASSEPVAIIGMGCRYPGGANTPAAFWDLLRNGVDTATEIPALRWDVNEYYDPDPDAAGKIYVRAGSFVEGIEQFDPRFFAMSPLEAASTDPQQRLLLEVAWEALEYAGIAADQLRNSQTGVFIGAFLDDYSALRMYTDAPDQIDAFRLLSSLRGITAGRLSFVLGLQGPTMQVDTACSSSLLAVHLACQSLRNKECSLAMAGGVYLVLAPHIVVGVCRSHAVSPDGRCKTFDARADGFGLADGCGVVVLKRLTDATRDGDNILALIRGSAVNHDGASNGITTPNGLAQEAMLRQALKNAGVTADQIQYVETHGTGTPVGDPIEVMALANVLGQPRRTKPLVLGSVKTNIGHASPAAGVAGLMKTVLSLQHREIPATLHLTQPNPRIPWQTLPVIVPTELTPWDAPDDSTLPRLAGVSAYGMTGTNVHVIVAEAPEVPVLPSPIERSHHLLCLSAKGENPDDRTALRDLARRYETFLASHPQDSLADICFTANNGRVHFPNRLAAVAESHEQLRQQLAAFADGREADRLVAGRVSPGSRPQVAFLFTGQGSQYAGMARQLYATQPTFRKVLERCDEILRGFVDKPLLQILYGEDKEQSEQWLDNPTYVQPTLFAVEYAMAELWRSWGIEPDVVLGHSIGEYSAACVAGVFGLEDGLRLIAERGRLVHARSVKGQMVAVLAEEARVRRAVEPFAADVSIAAINTPRSVVISGKCEAVQSVVEGLHAAGIETRALKVSAAYHSPLMEPVLAEYESVVRTVACRPPRIKIVSNVTGQVADDTHSVTTPEYWRRHLREPVRFAEGMATLAGLGIDAFVEIGPQPTLVVLGQQCLTNASDKAWLPSLRRRGDDWQQMLSSLSALYVRGAAVDWSGFDRDYVRHKLVLPTYPFQLKPYWLELDEHRARTLPAQKSQTLHPLLSRQVHSPAFHNGVIAFEATISPRLQGYLADHRVFEQAVLPTTAFLEMALAAGNVVLKSHGFSVQNVSIQQALILPEDEARETAVQMVLTPKEAGYGWGIFSLADHEDKPRWTLHASGDIVPLRVQGSSSADLPVLQARCKAPVDVASRYQLSREEGIDYGPAFQGLTKLFQGDGEALGQIRLPEELQEEAGKYKLHPALLDACLQVGQTIFPNEPGQVYLPTGVEGLTLSENGGGYSSLWCHAKIASQPTEAARRIDLDLFDERGVRVAQLSGLSVWSVNRRALLGNRLRTDWLYQIAWQPSKWAEQSAYAKGRGSWLILTDRQGIGSALAARLEAQGERCVVAANANLGTAPNEVRSEFHRLLQESNAGDGSGQPAWRGVVYLWSLDANGTDPHQVPDTVRELYAHVLQLVQSIVQSGARPRLWIVTRGAMADGADSMQLAQTPLWGLGRTIVWEHPELQCTCVDLDNSAQNLFDELWFADDENQVVLRHAERHVARLVRYHQTVRNPLPVNSESGYLITGGLGGLGLQVARWLVAQGARYLTLVGRSSATAFAQRAIEEMEQAGATVQLVRGDVSKYDDVAKMLADSQTLAPLKGIIHAAGVLEDGILLHQTVERFERVMDPKVRGSWNLHTLTEGLPLDFVVFFSSVTSLLGNGGQANYAAANAFMDALAHWRQTLGLPGLTINWGAWGEVGLAAEMAQRSDVESLTPQEGVDLLGELMQGTAAQVGVIPINWDKFQRQWTGRTIPLLSEMFQSVKPGKPASSFKQQIAAAAPEERLGLIKAQLQEEMSQVVGTIPADSQRFIDVGMTSLMAIQLANRLSNRLGVALSATAALEYPTIESLTNRVAELIFHTHSETSPGASTELKPVERDKDIPLSLAQQEWWQRAQLHPDTYARNLAYYFRLDGKLDVAILRASLDEMMRRHEILRTSFSKVNKVPVQVIAPALSANLSLIDLQSLPEREQSDQVERLAKEGTQLPFDFATAPLWRVALMWLGQESFVLGWVFHHIIIDATSSQIFLTELASIYNALGAGKPSPFPELPIQYADVAYWQQRFFTPEVLDTRRSYWQQWLEKEPQPLKLIIDRPHRQVETLRVRSQPLQISPDLTQELADLGRQSGSTLFVTVLASFATLLHWYSGCEEIVVGVPFTGRNHPLLESLIGLFTVGTIPLRMDLRGNPSFLELVDRARQVHLSALANGDVPLEPIVTSLQPERNLRQHPLCRVMLNLLTGLPGENLILSGLAATPLGTEAQIGRDLILNIWEEKNGSGTCLHGQWRYRQELYEPETIAALAEDFRVVLESVVRNPAQSVSAIPLVPISSTVGAKRI